MVTSDPPTTTPSLHNRLSSFSGTQTTESEKHALAVYSGQAVLEGSARGVRASGRRAQNRLFPGCPRQTLRDGAALNGGESERGNLREQTVSPSGVRGRGATQAMCKPTSRCPGSAPRPLRGRDSTSRAHGPLVLVTPSTGTKGSEPPDCEASHSVDGTPEARREAS